MQQTCTRNLHSNSINPKMSKAVRPPKAYEHSPQSDIFSLRTNIYYLLNIINILSIIFALGCAFSKCGLSEGACVCAPSIVYHRPRSSNAYIQIIIYMDGQPTLVPFKSILLFLMVCHFEALTYLLYTAVP